MAVASSITSGATITMPMASDANQCCQVVSISADGPENNRYVTAPPTPETAVPTIAASKQAQNLAQPADAEIGTEVALDECGCDQGLCCVAETQSGTGPERVRDQLMNYDRRNCHPGRNRPSRTGPQSDQDT